MVVIDSVNSKEADGSRRGHLIADIWDGLCGLQQWKMGFVRRFANHVAHALARVAVKQGVEGLWTENPPDCIADLLVAEQSALPLDY
jgi:hypothetical protein